MFSRIYNFISSILPLDSTIQAGTTKVIIRAISLLSLAFLSACGGVDSDEPEGTFVAPKVEWQLVFEDEFEGASLDENMWSVESGDGCPDLCGWGNNELQIYSQNNVSVSGGFLNIEGREENGGYTSGRVSTKGNFDFNYGRVEVMAKIPAGKGTWPAIWMLHSDPDIYGPWPLSGEIDIMEGFNYGVDGNNSISTSIHAGLPINDNTYTTGTTDLAVTADATFHEYALEWERGRMRFFVDGVHYQTIDQDNWFTYYPANPLGFYDEFGPYTLGLDDAPFDQAFHLILNFAIGGDAVGAPDANTLFPQTMQIDYVRVYECANSNPDTRRGCGSLDPAVVPLAMHAGSPIADQVTANPYIETLNLYVDGPETISVDIGGEVSTNTLSVDGFTGANATVVSDTAFVDPEDDTNTVWRVAISGDVANVFLTSEDLTDDELLDTGFDFSTNDLVGEIKFDMFVSSMSSDANIVIKLDSGFPNVGEVVLPASEIAVGEWKTYSIKFKDLVANPGFVDCCGGQGVSLDNVLNPFVFEVTAGSVDVLLDDIQITNACYIVGACKAQAKTKGIPDLAVFDDEVNLLTWTTGIAAADSGSGFSNYTDGTNPSNKANWQVVADADPDRGNVIDVTFNDSGEFGVWFIQSIGAVNAEAYSAGAVVFDIIVDDYGNNTTGMTMKIDCFFPCTSGDKNLGVIADGVWETVTIPVSTLTATGLDLTAVNTGIVIFPTNQSGTIRYRLDNIRWVADANVIPKSQIDLPVDFESATVDYSLIDFGGNGSSLTTDPDDADNDVAATIKGDASEVWAGTIIGTADGFANPIPFASGETEMSMRVWSPAAGVPVMLKIENADASVFSEVTATTTVANGWETLVWDFAGIDTNIDFVRAIVFFNFGVAGTGETYLWDDVAIGDGAAPLAQVDLPANFDEAGVDYDLGDFGGVATTLVTDPTNSMNMVASTNKAPGAELWGGTTVGATNGLASAIDFSGSTTLTVRVYSPDAGIPVRLKVEDASNPTVSVETEATTTVANAWEELSFDFSNEAMGTAALDLGATYNKLSIFFNFGTDGNTAGDKTYLWDDVGGDGSIQIDLPISFDNAQVNYDLLAFGNASVAGPVADPMDANNMVAQFNKPMGSELWAGAIMGTTDGLATAIPFTATETTMSVQVWSPDAGIPVRLKVENVADGSISVETEAVTTRAGEWETLVFDFANEVGGTAMLDTNAVYNRVVIFFNFGTDGNTAGDKVYYWDDVMFGEPLNLPITFDKASVTYEFVDFGGTGTGVIVDPTDGSNMVAETIKGSGSEVWAGTVISNGAGVADVIPFTATETSMSIRVFSPAAGIPVLLKIENADASVFAEVTVNTSASSAWETLVFDFSTVGFDETVAYVRPVIFFDFGTSGDGTSYIWDDLKFGDGT
jgi:beta-glucanase (GH16 family)